MFLLDRRHVLQIMAASGLSGLASARTALAAPSTTEVYTADATGGNVDSVVVMGDEAAILIDTQFTPDHATALADVIAASGRRLDTVFITHAHPDHYSGLPVIRERFPDVRAFAHGAIQPLIPADVAGAVEALDGDHLMLEGERLNVLDPMHGDTDLIAAVHIPALDTLVTADLGFADTHLWVAENTTPERMDLWRASLDRLEALGAGTVIPGHRAATSANDSSVFAYTRAYLDVWQEALAATSSAEELSAAMMAGREDMGLAFAIEVAVGAVYPE